MPEKEKHPVVPRGDRNMLNIELQHLFLGNMSGTETIRENPGP